MIARLATWARFAATGLTAIAAHACGGSFFACTDDDACARADGSGACEPTGWCSFPDDACASGSRYGGLAGDGLAGECVAPTGTESTGDATSTVDPSSATFTTTDPTTVTSSVPMTSTDDGSSDDAASPVCGNGRLEDDEACDDGNREPADGCSPACEPSGSLSWEQTIGGAAGSVSALALWANGDLLVGFTVALDAGTMPGVWRVEPDAGAVVWSESLDATQGGAPAVTDVDVQRVDGVEDAIVLVAEPQMEIGDSTVVRIDEGGDTMQAVVDPNHLALAVSRDPDGRGMVVGVDAFGNGYAKELDEEGELGGAVLGEPFMPNDGLPYDVLLDGDVTYVVGTQSGDPMPAFFGATVNEVALRHHFTPGAENRAYGIARDVATGRLWIGGTSTSFGGWVATIDRGGIGLQPELVTGGGGGQIVAIAVDPDGSAVAVGADGREGARNGRVVRIDPTGEVRWSGSYPTDGDDMLLDVAIAPDGALFVAGVRAVDDTAVAWFARLVP